MGNACAVSSLSKDSSRVEGLMRDYLRLDPKRHRIFVCKDESEKMQSISMVESCNSEDFRLDFLATHLENLSSQISWDGSFLVRGEGSAMINHLFRKCIEEG